ncbi:MULTISPECIES: hypothetical protein [Nocardiaceae]|uniref:hypothetical protein n=1 Tax=Nocardiaceae TaxID=85025 RepID=UPI000A86479A|nr:MULTISPECIES: hypothetical protein [Rhodococcus]
METENEDESVNLYERIAASLADTSVRINATVFEECATSLLSAMYSNLVPVRGGSDSGRDADLIQSPGDDPVRIAITSSRTENGARSNLRTAMNSLTEHGLPGKSLVSVSLAELNESKRRKLQELAEGAGYRVQAIVDRSFFADRLLVNGEWRKKLLGLRGGPFSLSRVPASITFGASAPSLVGRDGVLAQLQSLTSDIVVWGLPGVGKSALLSKIDGLYFVEGIPDDEQLMADILETQPSCIVVDDARRRLAVLDQLTVIRRQEQLVFTVVGVCWPHERDEVGASLPDSVEFEVEPLIRSDIAKIVRDRGVDGEIELAQILDQAQGRPGWAVYLADLTRADGGLPGVYRGTALHTRVLTYLGRAGLRTAARDVLALIALLGTLRDSEISGLAGQLGQGRAVLTQAINEVAVGGLLDVDHQLGSGGEYENTYRVAPEILAVPIAVEYFFGGTTPVISVQELFETWSQKRLEIAHSVVRCAVAGATDADPTARKLFDLVIDDVDVAGARDPLLKQFLHLGPAEAKHVVDRRVAEWRASVVDSAGTKRAAFDGVAGSVGAAIAHLYVFEVVEVAADVARQIRQAGEDPKSFWTRVVDKVRGFGPEGTIQVGLLTEMWVRIQRWIEDDGGVLSERTSVAVSALRQLLRPTFDASWMSAEDLNVARMVSATLPSDAMSTLRDRVWEPFAAQPSNLTRSDLKTLVDLASEWSRVARGLESRSNQPISEDEASIATVVAISIADYVVDASADYPGLRAQVRALAEPLGKDYPETDPLLAFLFEARPSGFKWEQWRSHTDQQARIHVAPYLLQDPEVLCERLALLKPEFDRSDWGVANRLYTVFAAIARSDVRLVSWLEAARTYGLLREAHSVLSRALDDYALEDDLFIVLLDEPSVRGTLMNTAVSERHANRYFDLIEPRATPQDIAELELVVRRNEHAESAVKKLLMSDRPDVQAATAAALLATSDDDGEFLTPELEPLWASAIAQLEVPMQFHLHGDHEFFDKLLVRAPHVYEEVFIGAMRRSSTADVFTVLDAFDHSGYKLDIDAKTRILEACPVDAARRRVFWALNGGDSKWVAHLLDTHVVDTEFVLHSANSIGPAIPIHDLARILVPRGVPPGQIANLIELGTHWGERHERIAGHLEQMKEYAQSPNPSVSSVGRAGIELFAPQLESARRQHKLRMIRGRR